MMVMMMMLMLMLMLMMTTMRIFTMHFLFEAMFTTYCFPRPFLLHVLSFQLERGGGKRSKVKMKIKCVAPRPRRCIIIFSLKGAQSSAIKLKMMIKCVVPRPQRFYHHFQFEKGPPRNRGGGRGGGVVPPGSVQEMTPAIPPRTPPLSRQ